MLIPREGMKCVEAIRETNEPGIVTPPNAHENFAQMYFIVSGKARVRMGGETKDTLGPAVAFVPQNANHYENIGDVLKIQLRVRGANPIRQARLRLHEHIGLKGL